MAPGSGLAGAAVAWPAKLVEAGGSPFNFEDDKQAIAEGRTNTASRSNSAPLGAGVTRFVLLTIGLIWLFVLSMVIVRQEEGDLRWPTVKRRLWL